jgi:hypothetical protein
MYSEWIIMYLPGRYDKYGSYIMSGFKKLSHVRHIRHHGILERENVLEPLSSL